MILLHGLFNTASKFVRENIHYNYILYTTTHCTVCSIYVRIDEVSNCFCPSAIVCINGGIFVYSPLLAATTGGAHYNPVNVYHRFPSRPAPRTGGGRRFIRFIYELPTAFVRYATAPLVLGAHPGIVVGVGGGRSNHRRVADRKIDWCEGEGGGYPSAAIAVPPETSARPARGDRSN